MRLLLTGVAFMLLFAIPACTTKESSQSLFTEKIRLTDLTGNPVDLNQQKGKAVFINIWATWCKPCVQEMPSIGRAQDILKDKNIKFLFASDEEKERIESFAAKKKLNIEFVLIGNLEELQIVALPQTYILNGKGDLVFSESGYREWDSPANLELLNKIIEGND